MNMLSIRRAQAGLIVRIWQSLCTQGGPELARSVLSEAIGADARAGGEAFARQATHGPRLDHFATVLERWQEGGALEITDIRLTPAALTFSVIRCGYAQAYAEMGLDPELGSILSCDRDEAFAAGYSPHLSMQRSRTIMEGSPACLFTFSWRE